MYTDETAVVCIDGVCYLLDTDVTCYHCGQVTLEYEAVDGKAYCEECYGALFTTCDDCDTVISRDDARTVGQQTYCDECFNEHFTTCDDCGCVVNLDYAFNIDGSSYCESCYSEIQTTCCNCGATISREEARSNDNDNDYCESCYPGDDSQTWSTGRFVPGHVYSEIGSHRKFGVELETSSCPDHSDLEGNTCFGCKEDGSITGKEFVSPPLSSDKGLAAIRHFCNLASEFEVDKACGYHVHFDITRECTANLKAIAEAYHVTYPLWASFVPRSRRTNHYCKRHDWSDFDDVITPDDFKEKIGCTDRYVWCNLSAYNKHGTVEIRLHSATLDPEKIVNWVRVHARFIDWAVKHTIREIRAYFQGTQEEQFVRLAAIWRDDELTDFYRHRIARFGTERALEEIC